MELNLLVIHAQPRLSLLRAMLISEVRAQSKGRHVLAENVPGRIRQLMNNG
jgi:hypothetical protein